MLVEVPLPARRRKVAALVGDGVRVPDLPPQRGTFLLSRGEKLAGLAGLT